MALLAIIRRLFGVKQAVSRVKALDIAQQYCLSMGWSWRLPISIHEGLRTWTIWTNSESRGGNAIISISMTTGEVDSAIVTPQ